MRLRIVLVGLAVVSSSSVVLAQEAAPEDPGIVLPPVLLEVEDLQVETVSAALPDDEDQLRPDVSIPLPDADELYLPEQVFDIPYPDQVGVTPGSAEATFTDYLPAKVSQREVFSDGQIGVGAPVYVLGDLGLYKLGDTPRFSLNFLHEKLDGYGFASPGSGFYHGQDILEGTLSLENEELSVGLSGEIGERSAGLQGREVDFDSVTQRLVSGIGSATFVVHPLFSLSGGLETSYFAQTLTASTPMTASEFGLVPSVGGTLSLERFDLSVAAEYGLHSTTEYELTPTIETTTTVDHRIQGGLEGRYHSESGLQIYLHAGLRWSSISSLNPDVRAGIEGGVGTNFRFQAEGGYATRSQPNRELLETRPFLGLATREPLRGWGVDLSAQARPVPALLLSSAIGLSADEGVVDPLGASDATTGLFDASSQQMIRFDPSLGVEWTITRGLGLSLAWDARFINRPTFEPVQRFELSFQAADAGERYGGQFEATMELWPVFTWARSLPNLSIGGYYRVSDTVRFQIDLADILSPVLEGGRLIWDPYVESGLNATLTTRISL